MTPVAPTAAGGAGAAALELLRAALAVEAEQEVGARLATRELISWAVRSDRSDLAAELSRAQRAAARAACAPWHERFGAEIGLELDAFADFVAVFYEGLAQAWIADPDGVDPGTVADAFCHLLEARATNR